MDRMKTLIKKSSARPLVSDFDPTPRAERLGFPGRAAGGSSAIGALVIACSLLGAACPRPPPQEPSGGTPASEATEDERVAEPSRRGEEAVAVVEVIAGELTVRVFAHSLATVKGDIPCWTYVSEGLLRHQQKEIVFTVQRGASEGVGAFPTDVFELYRVIDRLASQGRRVDAGDRTTLGAGSGPLFGSTRWRGLLYTHPIMMDGVQIDRPSLAGIVVSADEVAVAERVGMQRVLALLGSAFTFFPTAPWLDRVRADVTTLQDVELSILAVPPRLWIPRAIAYQLSEPPPPVGPRPPGHQQSVQPRSERVILELPRELPADTPRVLANATAGEALALMVAPDPGAEAALVWRPGQQGPAAISTPTADGSRIAGNFVLLLAGHAENEVQIMEDGFAIQLTQDAWREVLTAIARQEALALRGRDRRTIFELAWAAPGSADDATTGAVARKYIVLQTESRLLDERTSAEDLADYIVKIDAALAEVIPLSSSGPAVELRVTCKLAHGREPVVQAVARPDLNPELATAIQRRLASIPSPAIRKESVEFTVVYSLWGGPRE